MRTSRVKNIYTLHYYYYYYLFRLINIYYRYSFCSPGGVAARRRRMNIYAFVSCPSRECFSAHKRTCTTCIRRYYIIYWIPGIRYKTMAVVVMVCSFHERPTKLTGYYRNEENKLDGKTNICVYINIYIECFHDVSRTTNRRIFRFKLSEWTVRVNTTCCTRCTFRIVSMRRNHRLFPTIKQ